MKKKNRVVRAGTCFCTNRSRKKFFGRRFDFEQLDSGYYRVRFNGSSWKVDADEFEGNYAVELVHSPGSELRNKVLEVLAGHTSATIALADDLMNKLFTEANAGVIIKHFRSAGVSNF